MLVGIVTCITVSHLKARNSCYIVMLFCICHKYHIYHLKKECTILKIQVFYDASAIWAVNSFGVW
jgi:hypothetical protein